MINLKYTYYKKPDKQSVYLKDKKYTVFVYWERRVYFTDEKDCKKFLVDTSRFLSRLYFFLHDTNTRLFNIINEFVLFLDLDLYTKRNTRDLYNLCEKQFSVLLREKRAVDKLALDIAAFYKTIGMLMTNADELSDFAKRKKKYSYVHRLEVLSECMQLYKNKLDVFEL